jgi:hypothetical protein
MKPLLPTYCRPLGYAILALNLFGPFLLIMAGSVNNGNLLLLKECVKLLMMIGALMILFACSKQESKATEQIRANATRMAMFFTVLYVFGLMLYHVSTGVGVSADSTSFLTFLIINVLCLEFGMKRAKMENLFKN